MSETGTESGENPVQHPPGRAEIIRRSLEAMNEANIARIRPVYQPQAHDAEASGEAGESTDEPTG